MFNTSILASTQSTYLEKYIYRFKVVNHFFYLLMTQRRGGTCVDIRDYKSEKSLKMHKKNIFVLKTVLKKLITALRDYVCHKA